MNNRDMFYQNLNQGYNNPGMFVPPSGYNLNQQYQAYGNYQMNPNTINYDNTNNYEDRISKLERQVRNLDARLQKLETPNTEDNNFYMI